MDDPGLVGMIECVGDLAGDAKGLFDRKRPFALESSPEGLARHVGHHVVDEPVGLPRVVEREDVRMLQPRGDTDLVEEPLGSDRGRDLGPQHLERHVATVLDVPREKYEGHPTFTDGPDVGVAFGQGQAEALEYRIGQGRDGRIRGAWDSVSEWVGKNRPVKFPSRSRIAQAGAASGRAFLLARMPKPTF